MTTPSGRLRLIAATLALSALIAGCKNAADASRAGPAAPQAVEVVTAQAQALTLTRELPGRIEPVRVAEVRARVAGIVLSRHFEEGADIEAGSVLFQIDPAPFHAALSRAEGELARADAALGDAQAVVRRYAPLVKIEAVSRQDFDTAQAALKSAQAARRSAQAQVETARLELDYATVKAPISGRIGRALVTEGALVGQGEATPLAVIQQLDSVYADFKQPVADFVRLREAATGHGLPENGAEISVAVEGTDLLLPGHLLFSDITVDRTTGQISLRGRLDNPDGLLLPGMYVRVRTTLGHDPRAILVPQRAVHRDGAGEPRVFVVGAGDVVEARAVRTGTMHGPDWHVLEGLMPGDRVIVGGAARPGAQVAVAQPSSL